MPFCRNCGNENSEGAEYCSSCGTVIASANLMLASWGERFVAWLIDMVVLGVLLSWMVWPGFYWLPGAWGTMFPNWIPFIDLGFRNIIYFLYWTVLEGTYGQSLGKKVMKIEVIHINGQELDLGKAAYQSIGKAFLLPLDCIFGWIQYSSKQQRLFNYLSNTVVVKTSE
ncbi:MAG: RDD family protein [Candidatus Thorarchaeota archaeon]